jgi:hypothetical protein
MFLKNAIYKLNIFNKSPILLTKFQFTKNPSRIYVDATNLKPENVLAELYNSSKPYGMGIFQYKANVMSSKQAEDILKEFYDNNEYAYFDYLDGRPIKTTFEYFPNIDATTYDKYNGDGSMSKCIENVRNSTITIVPPINNITDEDKKNVLKWLDNQ